MPSLQTASMGKTLNTRLGGWTSATVYTVQFQPKKHVLPCNGVVCAAGEMLLCIHSPLQLLGWSWETGGDPGASPGCRAAATACPMGRIFCLCDLPLTFAVTAGKADPIDFMWIMIFRILP